MTYSGIVSDDSGPVTTFTSNTENATVSSLSCCSDYSYIVVARTGAGGDGLPSQPFTFSTSAQSDGMCDYWIIL